MTTEPPARRRRVSQWDEMERLTPREDQTAAQRIDPMAALEQEQLESQAGVGDTAATPAARATTVTAAPQGDELFEAFQRGATTLVVAARPEVGGTNRDKKEKKRKKRQSYSSEMY